MSTLGAFEEGICVVISCYISFIFYFWECLCSAEGDVPSLSNWARANIFF